MDGVIEGFFFLVKAKQEARKTHQIRDLDTCAIAAYLSFTQYTWFPRFFLFFVFF
jgi:hypothetical protein